MIDQETWLNIALVVVFVLVGGVFAATEIALVSLRESQLNALERRGSRGAKVAALGRDPNRFLSAVQIGVTFAGFFSAAYGASTIAPDVAPYLQRLGLSETAAGTAALIVMTLLISYLSLVLGELVPKRLALQRAEGFSLAVAPPLDRFATLMRPVIWLLSVSTNALVRLLGGDPHARSESMSEEELRDLVVEHDELDAEAKSILSDVFDARERTLRESMRPRHEVAFLEADLTVGEATRKALEQGHTRYPVIGASADDVVGFVHLRDLLLHAPENTGAPLRAVTREVLVLPDTRSILSTLGEMRRIGAQLAVVIDEYGGTAGIATLEDLVEDVVGQIRDEYDDDEQTDAASGGPLEIDGATVLEDFADHGGVPLPDGDYETVAGFIQTTLERIPTTGDRVEVDGGVLIVAAMDGYRVERVRFEPREADVSAPDAD